MKLSLRSESWLLRKPFNISGFSFTTSDCIVVEITHRNCVGRGEASGIFFLDEDIQSMTAQIEKIASRIEDGLDRSELQELLPRGGARNAVDCALWDLEAKLSGRSAAETANLSPLRPLQTVVTIGLAPPEEMAAEAKRLADISTLKIKVDARRPLEILSAIREARPEARLVIDANQGWSFDALTQLLPELEKLGVAMIEQPLPRGKDQVLAGLNSPIPLSADESCIDISDLDDVADRYRMITIKLDKTGGLTAALDLARAARARNLDLMIGNMTGTSLASAPGFLVGQLCSLVDLDGPLLLRYDRAYGQIYEGDLLMPPDLLLWG